MSLLAMICKLLKARKMSVSLIFRDFLLLSIESHSSAFSFCFTFSAFMNLGETLTSCDLKRVILCGSVLI